MDYRDRLPFPLFPHLFPGLFAVWYFDHALFGEDPDEDAEEGMDAGSDRDPDAGSRRGSGPGSRRGSGPASGPASGPGSGPGSRPGPGPRSGPRRRPLSPHTQRTLAALLRLLDTRPVQEFPNLLTDPWQLHAILDGLPAPPRLTFDDLDDLARLRDHLGEALLATGPLEAHELLNELALTNGVTPQLTGEGELTHWTVFRDATAVLAALFVPAVMEFHASGWSERVRECAEPRCWAYFLDLSNRGNQRNCSTACAARARKRRHRERIEAAAHPPRLER